MRRYCNATCRKAAERERRQALSATENLAELDDLNLASADLSPRAVPTEEQIALAILEARSAASALVRLGRSAQPRLAGRCAAVGEAICKALNDHFPGV
jgi:hypothetical protein